MSRNPGKCLFLLSSLAFVVDLLPFLTWSFPLFAKFFKLDKIWSCCSASSVDFSSDSSTYKASNLYSNLFSGASRNSGCTMVIRECPRRKLKGTVQRKLYGSNRQLMVSSCSDGHFFKFKGPSLFKKRKRVFSVKRHFVVEWPVNVETAANFCYSGALQAAITVILACRAPLPL
jgi:hypothetical protein